MGQSQGSLEGMGMTQGIMLLFGRGNGCLSPGIQVSRAVG